MYLGKLRLLKQDDGEPDDESLDESAEATGMLEDESADSNSEDDIIPAEFTGDSTSESDQGSTCTFRPLPHKIDTMTII